MKKNLYLFLIQLVILTSCDRHDQKKLQLQQATNDSLNKFLKDAYDDTKNPEFRFMQNTKALAIVNDMKNDSMTRVYYFRIANRFWNMDAIPSYNQVLQKNLKKAKDAHDDHALAKVYDYMSDTFNRSGIRDSAFYYADKSEKTYIRLKDTTNVARAILKKAGAQFAAFDFIGTQKNVYRAIKLLGNRRSDKDKYLLASTYSLLGSVNDETGTDYRKSIHYYEKGKEICGTMTDTVKLHFRSVLDGNIAIVYTNAGQAEKAIPYFKSVLRDKLLRFELPITYSRVLNNYAQAKLTTGDLTELPEMFFKSRKLADSIEDWSYYSNASLGLSEYYRIQKNPVLALTYAKQAYTVARGHQAYKEIYSSLKALAKLDIKNANRYYATFIHVKDSLQLLERLNPDKFAKIEYQVDQFKVQQQRVKADRDKANRKLEITSVFFILITLVATILYLIISRKNKVRSLALIKEQQRTNDELYKLISDQQQKFEQGKQSEKRRISHELHDGVMGRLSSIRLNLSVLTKRPDAETIPKCVEYISDIQEVEKEIRTIAYDLDKNLFSGTKNFETVVRNLYAGLESHSGIAFTFTTDTMINWEAINNNTKMQVYRIMQEGLNNIEKYARATNVTIGMKHKGDKVVINIADDGVGFDYNEVEHGIGLRSMVSRARSIQGQLKVTSKPKAGTNLILTFKI